MNSIILIIVGLLILCFIIIGPIYCVVKLAGFKKRNKAIWGLFAIIAIVPSFVVVSFVPSLRDYSDKEAYRGKFTRHYDKPGYGVVAVLSLLLIGLYYFKYVSNPTIHPLYNSWLLVHFILLSMACSAIVGAFILSIIRMIANSNFPAVVLVLQIAAVILLTLSIIAGSIFAHFAFGMYWSWDPKETWSLILLSVSIMVYTYCFIRVPNRVSQFLASVAHVGVFVLIIHGVPYLPKGLWSIVL